MGCRSFIILIAAILGLLQGLITGNGEEILACIGIFVAYGVIYFISYMINNSDGK